MYFALFIVAQDEGNSVYCKCNFLVLIHTLLFCIICNLPSYIIFLVLRKLQDFESPFITIKHIHTIGSRVVLGKNYWDVGYDLELMNNTVAMNLLYIQVVAEIQRGWISVTDELKDRLTILQNQENKKEVCCNIYCNTKSKIDWFFDKF